MDRRYDAADPYPGPAIQRDTFATISKNADQAAAGMHPILPWRNKGGSALPELFRLSLLPNFSSAAVTLLSNAAPFLRAEAADCGMNVPFRD